MSIRRDNLPGPITGHGPGFKRAMKLHALRQARRAQVGTWRCAPCKWKHNNGTYIDPDWYIIGERND